MKKSIVLTAIHVTTTTAKQFVLKVTYIHMSCCSQRPSFFFWSLYTSILSLFKLHVLCEILEGLLAGWSTSVILAYKDRLIRPLREHFAVV